MRVASGSSYMDVNGWHVYEASLIKQGSEGNAQWGEGGRDGLGEEGGSDGGSLAILV
jgi:hypothetical protein